MMGVIVRYCSRNRCPVVFWGRRFAELWGGSCPRVWISVCRLCCLREVASSLLSDESTDPERLLLSSGILAGIPFPLLSKATEFPKQGLETDTVLLHLVGCSGGDCQVRLPTCVWRLISSSMTHGTGFEEPQPLPPTPPVVLAVAEILPSCSHLIVMPSSSPPYAAVQRQVRSSESSHLQTSTASKNNPTRYCASRTVWPLRSLAI